MERTLVIYVQTLKLALAISFQTLNQHSLCQFKHWTSACYLCANIEPTLVLVPTLSQHAVMCKEMSQQLLWYTQTLSPCFTEPGRCCHTIIYPTFIHANHRQPNTSGFIREMGVWGTSFDCEFNETNKSSTYCPCLSVPLTSLGWLLSDFSKFRSEDVLH